MKGTLGTRLQMISTAVGSYSNEQALALLTTGATLALARVVEMDGYSFEAKVKSAQKELTDAPATTPEPEHEPETAPAAPVIPDDSPL